MVEHEPEQDFRNLIVKIVKIIIMYLFYMNETFFSFKNILNHSLTKNYFRI